MARLIDATRIEQYILNNCSDNEEINAIYAEIVDAPTVDAEPVVRCKDCQYFGRLDHEIYCYMLGANKTIKFSENGYCAWGERKENK